MVILANYHGILSHATNAQYPYIIYVKGDDDMTFKKWRSSISHACIILAICVILCIYSSASSSLHWYCKRTKDHSQPAVDTELSLIENYGGIYVDKAHASDAQDKVLYLTFDAGYENGNVEKILDVLKQEQVPGAFFILGNLIQRNPDLIRPMANEGHLVCNHTYTHKDITKLTKEQINKELSDLEHAYSAVTGKSMDKYFRPPEGTFDKDSLQVIHEAGYKTVFWSFAYADWDNSKQMSVQSAKQKIMENLHNGEIMLLHPTSSTNAQLMQDLIHELKQRGYRFGTLDELVIDS